MLGESLGPEEYTNRLADEIHQVDHADLGNWSDLVFDAWEQQARVFIIGNGGSRAAPTQLVFLVKAGPTAARPQIFDVFK